MCTIVYTKIVPYFSRKSCESIFLYTIAYTKVVSCKVVSCESGCLQLYNLQLYNLQLATSSQSPIFLLYFFLPIQIYSLSDFVV